MIPTYEDILNAIAKAFRVTPEIAAHWLTEHVGIGMRDEFAMAALTGLFSVQYLPNEGRPPLERVVEAAYKYADAMLAERAK